MSPPVRLRTGALLTALLALAALPAPARDTEAGRLKARACAVCHGPLGISSQPDAPHLAGQPAIYLAAQLRAYRSGARQHEVMAVMAKALTDDDIADLAAWFTSIRIEAQPPR
ncbi:MAG: cytochrome c [Rubrivivax sp.]|nr:cytochrome c [Rubrivivax sp.]